MIHFTHTTLHETVVNDIWVKNEDMGALFYKGWKFELFRHWIKGEQRCWLIIFQRPPNDLGHSPVEMQYHYSDEELSEDICQEFFNYKTWESSVHGIHTDV